MVVKGNWVIKFFSFYKNKNFVAAVVHLLEKSRKVIVMSLYFLISSFNGSTEV